MGAWKLPRSMHDNALRGGRWPSMPTYIMHPHHCSSVSVICNNYLWCWPLTRLHSTTTRWGFSLSFLHLPGYGLIKMLLREVWEQRDVDWRGGYLCKLWDTTEKGQSDIQMALVVGISSQISIILILMLVSYWSVSEQWDWYFRFVSTYCTCTDWFYYI